MKSPKNGQVTPENRPESAKTTALPDFAHRISAQETAYEAAGLALERAGAVLALLADQRADIAPLLDAARMDILDAGAFLAMAPGQEPAIPPASGVERGGAERSITGELAELRALMIHLDTTLVDAATDTLDGIAALRAGLPRTQSASHDEPASGQPLQAEQEEMPGHLCHTVGQLHSLLLAAHNVLNSTLDGRSLDKTNWLLGVALERSQKLFDFTFGAEPEVPEPGGVDDHAEG